MSNDSSQCSALAATISAFVSPFKKETKGDINEGTPSSWNSIILVQYRF